MAHSHLSILDCIRHWSVESPAKTAILFLAANGDLQEMSYSALWREVAQTAARLGELPQQSRVGLLAPHGPVFLIEALAILSAGHCLVPINPVSPPNHRAELIERAGLHALRDAENDTVALQSGQPIDGQADESYRALGPAYLRFTSGSTGRRKGVLLSHRTILERTEVANRRLYIAPQDRVLCLLPMVDHFVVSILLYLRYGATILLVEQEENAPSIAFDQRATVLYGAPAQFASFTEKLPDLRLAVSTTQSLSADIARSFLANTGHPLVQALGIIEVGLLTLNEDAAIVDPLLAGVPMPDYRVAIVGGNQRDGKLHVAGPGLLDAYVSPWCPRESLLTDAGFPTGDHGWIDEAGCLHLVGREKNRIEIDGETFFLEELETVFNRHPGIRETLLYQKQDGLHAQIIAENEPLSRESLADWLAENLPFPPERIACEWVTSLPRTPTGKLARPVADK